MAVSEDFQIRPNAEDPDSFNVYDELRFPMRSTKEIQEHREERVERGSSGF